MRKTALFYRDWRGEWPSLAFMQPYFLDPSLHDWFGDTGNDTAGLRLEGIDSTGHLGIGEGRKDIRLSMWGNTKHGVLLIHTRPGNGKLQAHSSKGDLSRLGELIRGKHDTPLPVGLFIPFEKAWLAVTEFVEMEGALPKSIEWIANSELPANTFPDP
jgi:Immunity protein Imm1